MVTLEKYKQGKSLSKAELKEVADMVGASYNSSDTKANIRESIDNLITERYRVRDEFKGKVVMGNCGVVVLNRATQKQLKALYDNGHKEKIKYC